MDNSRSYYSNSLLSEYLKPSQEDLHYSEEVPTISVDPPQLPHGSTHSTVSNATPLVGSPKSSLTQPLSTSLSNQTSTYSHGSSATSVFSCESGFSDDIDLQSVKIKMEDLSLSKKHNRMHRLKRFFKNEKLEEPQDEHSSFFHTLLLTLKRDYYSYEKNETLNVNWQEACEKFAFGDSLKNIFPTTEEQIRYLTQSEFELGELRFSNLNKFHHAGKDPASLLRAAVPALQDFNDVLDLYAESDSNIKRQDLFQVFSRYANHSDGLCIPLAIAMFGNWLLSFNRDKSVENNYENSLILDYFRKALRMSLVMKLVAPQLEKEIDKFDPHLKPLLRRYVAKDNQYALSLSLHSLGEYYQYIHDHDTAVTLWELNVHLTKDLESGNLAVLGLTDGYGFGNKIKENHFGKKSKTNKFNTKRRVAHIYRILMERPDFHEYGVSWASKEKYD